MKRPSDRLRRERERRLLASQEVLEAKEKMLVVQQRLRAEAWVAWLLDEPIEVVPARGSAR